MKRLFYIFAFFLVSLSVMAKTMTGGEVLYLNANFWDPNSARFAAYFYGTGNKWVSMTSIGGGVYEVIVPSGSWTNVIFCRMDKGNQTNNWNNKWNQTGDLTWDGDKSLFIINSWDGQMSGWNSFTLDGDSEIYFDKLSDWSDEVTFMIGHSSYSAANKMNKIANTNLFYKKMTKWEGYTEWAFFNETWNDGEGHNIGHRANSSKKETSVYKTLLQKCNLFSGDKNVSLSSYTDLNHTLTINVTTDGKTSTTGGTITASSYNLTAANTSSQTNGSASGAETTISAVYTATVTLKATSKTGYSFVGWFDGSTSLSSNVNFDYTAGNTDKTLTAKFKINTYTIAATAGDGGSVTGGGSYNYNTTATLIATANRGYKFIRWNDGNTENPRKVTVSKGATYTAVFDKLCEYDELDEKTTYYVSASTIKVANKYENEEVEGIETVVDGVYSITIPSTSVYDRLVLDDKTFNTSQITTKYYNGSEWLYCDVENTLNLSGEPQCGLYGTINFQKTISGEDVNKWHWISLPYNVKISEIEGGDYGSDFIIQEYDSEVRAQWTSIKSSENKDKVTWRTLDEKETLMAGKGYILAVDGERGDSWNLIFKSANALNVVEDTHNGVNINYTSSVAGNSNWHLIGTGVYGTANSYSAVNYVAKPDGDDYTYHFLKDEVDNSFNPSSLSVSALEPYTAFFVQHGGDYSFSKVAAKSNAAPRRVQAEEMVEQYYVNIVGMADSSHTAIFLAEDGSDEYVVGQDFLHFGASGSALQLYTMQGETTMSFNYLKREERTIDLGGYVVESGKYTISLNAMGSASSVVLYDKATGLVVDLLNENYEFEAEKGALDGRFDVRISYAKGDGPATDVEQGENDGLVVLNYDEIVVFEGLTIGGDVIVYDVAGRCVAQFEANNHVANVTLESGVYVLNHDGRIVKFVVNR